MSGSRQVLARIRIPVGPVRLMAGLAEDACRVVGREAPFGRSTVDKILEDAAVSGDARTCELGFQPRMDIWSGWRDVVQRRRN